MQREAKKRGESLNRGPRVPAELEAEVIKEELRPVVKEALTQDVRAAIGRLMGLWPLAAEAIQADLTSPDPIARREAYKTLARYTVGQTPLVAGNDETGGGLVVHFNLPRPAQASERSAEEPIPLATESTELRNCLVCGEDKPLEEFVDGSDRCEVCHERLKTKEREILEGTGAP